MYTRKDYRQFFGGYKRPTKTPSRPLIQTRGLKERLSDEQKLVAELYKEGYEELKEIFEATREADRRLDRMAHEFDQNNLNYSTTSVDSSNSGQTVQNGASYSSGQTADSQSTNSTSQSTNSADSQSTNSTDSQSTNSADSQSTNSADSQSTNSAGSQSTNSTDSQSTNSTGSQSNNSTDSDATSTAPRRRPANPRDNLAISAACKLLLDQMFYDVREKAGSFAVAVNLLEPMFRSKANPWLERLIAAYVFAKKEREVTPEMYATISCKSKYILIALLIIVANIFIYEKLKELEKLFSEVNELQKRYDQALLQHGGDVAAVNQILTKLEAIAKQKEYYEKALHEISTVVRELDEGEKSYVQKLLTNYIHSNITNEAHRNFEVKEHLKNTSDSIESPGYREMAKIGSVDGAIFHCEDQVKKLSSDINGINERLQEVQERTMKKKALVEEVGTNLDKTQAKLKEKTKYLGVFFKQPSEPKETEQYNTHIPSLE
ncbi:hypothetical protein DGG96_11615 [Legionella qingyii]|uniref:Uncharacterized protein n=1 Tax=Legionella qingyii TaxID=2184757 RepID=A0A317U0Q7_9GAMM|nr:hypothetical protein [Legionella qingyii]PWY55421.1 hypothetical protein DGG96_11615 [Legionella qingyii]